MNPGIYCLSQTLYLLCSNALVLLSQGTGGFGQTMSFAFIVMLFSFRLPVCIARLIDR